MRFGKRENNLLRKILNIVCETHILYKQKIPHKDFALIL